MFKPKMHLFVDFIKKHFKFTSCIAPSCLFGPAGMQIFCRGTVYAKGAKGDIFMYNNTVWPQTDALCGFEPKKLRSLHKGVCYN
ncbi:hypothetical protein [Hominenteromicrobium sp.]|uniref:hypothetical protein n=1 Tax=Hominenteromicrobium sp. TaxID=3073581 RepID=UPI003AEFDC75